MTKLFCQKLHKSVNFCPLKDYILLRGAAIYLISVDLLLYIKNNYYLVFKPTHLD